MVRIEEVVGEGPELSESQRKVLQLMEMHSGWLFRMHNDDLAKIQAWLARPEAPEPPSEIPAAPAARMVSLGTIRWAISTLRARRKIGSIVIHRRTYYGSHETISKAQEALEHREAISGVHRRPGRRRLPPPNRTARAS